MRSDMRFDFLQDAELDRFHLIEEHKPARTPFPAETPIAMAYVPFQQWNTVYTTEDGMQNGTIFPELHKPFCPGGEPYA